MKKKGFTLAELLTVIVIIGVLSTTAIIAVNRYRKSSHQKYYDKQLELFKIAGQSYFTDYKSELPTINMDSRRVTLETLISKNYINKIVDINKKTCDVVKSIVQVQKKSTGKYVYSAYLKCPDETVGSIKNSNDIGQFNYELIYNNGAVTKEQTETDVYKYYTNDQVSYSLTIKAKNGEKLLGYRYKIYKNDKEVKESENIYTDNTSSELKDTISIDKKTYVDGNYTIGIIPINKDGKTIEQYYKFLNIVTIIDTNKPTCKITLPPESKKVRGWYNSKSGDASITLSDSNLSGYKIGNTDSFPLAFNAVSGSNYIETIKLLNTTGNGQKFYGFVKDKAGNIGKCETALIYVDKDAPKCEINVYGNKGLDNWYIQKPAIYLNNKTLEDIGYSGINSYGLSTLENDYNNIAEGIQPDVKSIKWYGIIKDNAGNVNTCKSDLKVDSTLPRCVSAGGSSVWLNKTMTLTGTCSDDTSGCVRHVQLDFYEGNGNYSPGTVYDNAGNSFDCPTQSVHIDRISPTCPTSWGEDEPEAKSKFVNNSIMFTPIIENDQGGSGIKDMDWNKYYADLSKNKSYSNKSYNELFNTGKANLEYDGANVYATLIIHDNAGNPSPVCQTPYYKIDMTKPYFSVLSNDNHTNGFYNPGDHNRMPRTVYCNDALSGVNLKSFETDLIKDNEFVAGQGTENKVNSKRLINNNQAEIKYVYDANGRKRTMFICKDKAGNERQEFIDDEKGICCRCRASSDRGCTTSNGVTTCKFKKGSVVYSEDDSQTNGNLYFCDNEHTVNGVTFNAGITNRTGNEMYLSCSKCS